MDADLFIRRLVQAFPPLFEKDRSYVEQVSVLGPPQFKSVHPANSFLDAGNELMGRRRVEYLVIFP